ncbi:hypothetical protein PTTG_07652 [Puccinia triticina 1-1 BBBD Race 1]|uniref:Uncharacterized protein n=1 Tax=Puccinia triticina (isolate 1-1 / race 1 (BBBD)) TaxID=630390 RepID=A0A180G562_PUCT1|nr:hypothetical protein PTTG_07652 [Puccinia triticina 1-1 BBBD Race 1]
MNAEPLGEDSGEGNEGLGQTGAPTGAGGSDAQDNGREHSWITNIIDRILPNLADAPDGSRSAGSRPAGSLNTESITERQRLDPNFIVEHARGVRAHEEERGARSREERRARGIAKKATLNEHCDKYSRGIQHFLKFFLGGPTDPQDYPASPSSQEKEALYWVDGRSRLIIEQLERLRSSLSSRSTAEQDFFLAQAEKEIRKNIPLPVFHPAPRKGDLGGGKPISLQTKGDVERALALAGISRFTFDWHVPGDEDSTWNSVVVEVMGSKAVEWLGRSMKISQEESGQAAAIINRWLKTKSKEIQQYGGMDLTEYNSLKSKKATKALYQRWRKKIKDARCRMADSVFHEIPQLAVVLEDNDCHSDIEDGPDGGNPISVFPPWRSIHLTEILHHLDRMVQVQATHHKTIETNKKMYARSARNHKKNVGGPIGVARDWPNDCYDQAFWRGLSKFEQDTISKVDKVDIENLALGLTKLCRTGHNTGTSGPPDRGGTGGAQKRRQSHDHSEGTGGGVPGPSGSMNVD